MYTTWCLAASHRQLKPPGGTKAAKSCRRHLVFSRRCKLFERDCTCKKEWFKKHEKYLASNKENTKMATTVHFCVKFNYPCSTSLIFRVCTFRGTVMALFVISTTNKIYHPRAAKKSLVSSCSFSLLVHSHP